MPRLGRQQLLHVGLGQRTACRARQAQPCCHALPMLRLGQRVVSRARRAQRTAALGAWAHGSRVQGSRGRAEAARTELGAVDPEQSSTGRMGLGCRDWGHSGQAQAARGVQGAVDPEQSSWNLGGSAAAAAPGSGRSQRAQRREPRSYHPALPHGYMSSPGCLPSCPRALHSRQTPRRRRCSPHASKPWTPPGQNFRR